MGTWINLNPFVVVADEWNGEQITEHCVVLIGGTNPRKYKAVPCNETLTNTLVCQDPSFLYQHQMDDAILERSWNQTAEACTSLGMTLPHHMDSLQRRYLGSNDLPISVVYLTLTRSGVRQ